MPDLWELRAASSMQPQGSLTRLQAQQTSPLQLILVLPAQARAQACAQGSGPFGRDLYDGRQLTLVLLQNPEP